MESELSLLYQTYDAFNAHDIDAALETMAPDVEWPNGWEGGWLKGHDAVRDHWTRQWQDADPRIQPIGYLRLPDGRLRLDVEQKVRDKNGDPIAEGYVGHTFTIRDGLIVKMEIG